MVSDVRANGRRTRQGILYIGVLGVIGVSLAYAGYALQWGFFAYATSAFFLFMTVLGVGSTVRGGGAWTADCPSCDAPLTSAELGGSLRGDKVIRCPKCRTYLGGSDVLKPVQSGYVHPEPVFQAPLPDDAVWPQGCAQCGDTPTRYLSVSNAKPSKMVSVTGSGRQRVFRMQVPACDRHAEPVWIWSRDSNSVVVFRSFEMFATFVTLNDAPADAPADVALAQDAPTTSALIKHVNVRRFAQSYGPGEHLNGLLIVPEAGWLDPVLDGWLGGPAPNRTPLAYTGLGDILYFRDHSERARDRGLDDHLVGVACDFSLLQARNGVVGKIAVGVSELLHNLEDPSFVEQVLGGGLFAEGVALVGHPQPRAILGFVPALVLGGAALPGKLQRLSALEHWEILRQLTDAVEEDVAQQSCHVHGEALTTVDGWRSHISSLPSHRWMDLAAQNPFCLNIGEFVDKPERPPTSPEMLRYCAACERAMANLWAKR